MNCGSCGAPSGCDGVEQDFRACPSCHRRLLALGSPACNYCGRRLPDDYIKAREADLKRIAKVEGAEGASDRNSKVGEFFSETGRKNRSGSSVLGLVDLSSLFDLFS